MSTTTTAKRIAAQMRRLKRMVGKLADAAVVLGATVEAGVAVDGTTAGRDGVAVADADADAEAEADAEAVADAAVRMN